MILPSPRRSQRRRAAARSPWRVDLCLARALLATPFGPSAMCFLRSTRVFGWLDPNTNSETADTRPEITHPNNRPDYAQLILNSPFCQLCSPTHSAPLWQTLSFFRRSPILSKIDSLAFSQKQPSCRLPRPCAATTLFSNKNAFNAVLEPCFLDRFSKNPCFAPISSRAFHVEQFLAF
jgi:hypothetical protein